MALLQRQLAAIFAKLKDKRERGEREREVPKPRKITSVADVPDVIKRVGFDFDWSEKKVWALKNVPTTKMPISDLAWHFDIPFLTHQGRDYTLKPQRLLENPKVDPGEYKRIVRADMRYPLDIMENKGRWLLLDGLHRLMKARLRGDKDVRVRIIPRERIPEILE